jgi:hypothetical protein
MIKYDLRCGHDHTFEVWFRDSAACDEQVAAGEVTCPHCGATAVRKALMAPALAKSGDRDPSEKRALALARQLHLMREFRRQVEANCDNVGSAFPEEARRIHYGETEHRNIFGEADLAEAKALVEEGIDIFPVPGPVRDDAGGSCGLF